MNKIILIAIAFLFLLVGFSALSETIYFDEPIETVVTGDTLTVNVTIPYEEVTGETPETPPEEPTTPSTPSVKYPNLQIGEISTTYSCTDVVCKENEPPHIVYVPREDFVKFEGGMDLSIPFEGFKEGAKMFVGINKMPELDTTKNSDADYPLTSPSSIIFSEYKNGKGFSTQSLDFIIEKWDGTTFEIYACQQKEAGGKLCDLTGYKDGKPTYGSYPSYVEPNYEAASLVIQLEPLEEEEEEEEEFEPPENACVEAMKNAKEYESIINAKAGDMPRNLLRALIEVDGWNNAESRIEDIAGKHVIYNNYVKGLSCEDGDIVFSKSGDAKATWNTALTVARHKLEEAKVKCTYIADEFTREDYVPNVLAWYRVFTENYGKDESSADYCKARVGVPEKAKAPTEPTEPSKVALECEKCNSVDQCLACIDWKFLGGVFK